MKQTNTAARFRGAPLDFVIDVRSKLEFWIGHLPNARCVPVDRLPDGLSSIDGLTHDSRILVYCASGARSAAAAQLLKGAGYRHVVDGGGLRDAQAEFAG